MNALTKMVRSVGSRIEVWEGTALKTSSGLQKKDFIMKRGKVVSKKRSEASKKNCERLKQYQFQKANEVNK